MKENINDIIRSRISKKLVGKSTIEYEKEIETFYNEIKNNPERNILSIDVLYSTSFMIKILLKKCVKTLLRFTIVVILLGKNMF